jgi:hypothetical protein
MAAVTVDRSRTAVFGNRRVRLATVDIAADADTWVSGLRRIESLSAISETNAAIGATFSGGTVTFQTGGAESNVLVQAVGF